MSVRAKYKFGTRSLANLERVHTDLVVVAHDAIKWHDCSVVDGIRTFEEQKKNILKGVSKTMDSKHLPRNEKGELDENGVAHAIDLIPYPIDYPTIERGLKALRAVDSALKTLQAYAFGGLVLGLAAGRGIDLRWGADWNENNEFGDHSFIDLPHFEIKR